MDGKEIVKLIQIFVFKLKFLRRLYDILDCTLNFCFDLNLKFQFMGLNEKARHGEFQYCARHRQQL